MGLPCKVRYPRTFERVWAVLEHMPSEFLGRLFAVKHDSGILCRKPNKRKVHTPNKNTIRNPFREHNSGIVCRKPIISTEIPYIVRSHWYRNPLLEATGTIVMFMYEATSTECTFSLPRVLEGGSIAHLQCVAHNVLMSNDLGICYFCYVWYV